MFNEGQGLWEDAEAHEIGAGNLEVDLAIVVDAEDFVDHLRACGLHLVADLGHRRWLRRNGFLPGFGHDSR